MIIAGLTGSIAMGKTEAGKLFAARGIPVFDSDGAVHQLYARGGGAVALIAGLVPEAIVDGAVDRKRLAEHILRHPPLLQRIEQAVHPLVKSMQQNFLEEARSKKEPLVILDIPLLFETGRQGEADKIIVVSASADIQRARALRRPGMTPGKLDFILSKQVPDAEKRRRADYVIDTGGELAETAIQVDRIIAGLIAPKEEQNDQGNHPRH